MVFECKFACGETSGVYKPCPIQTNQMRHEMFRFVGRFMKIRALCCITADKPQNEVLLFPVCAHLYSLFFASTEANYLWMGASLQTDDLFKE